VVSKVAIRHSTWLRNGCSVDVIWWLSLRYVTVVYMCFVFVNKRVG